MVLHLVAHGDEFQLASLRVVISPHAQWTDNKIATPFREHHFDGGDDYLGVPLSRSDGNQMKRFGWRTAVTPVRWGSMTDVLFDREARTDILDC